jgi:DNA polymerase-3 subunit beta
MAGKELTMGPNLKSATDTASATSAPSNPPDNSAGLAFRCDQSGLKSIATMLAKVADHKSCMPMLANVMIRVGSDGATFVATDLNVTAIVRAPAWLGARGGFCVGAKALADLAKKLPKGEILVRRAAHTTLEVASGNLSCVLQGMNDRDFPKIPDDQELAWSDCDARSFADMIGRVDHAICKDETRFHLNGIRVEMRDGRIRMVTTDGHRLALVDRATALTTPAYTDGIILPAKAAKAITALLAGSKKRDALGTCQIALPNRKGSGVTHLFVRYGGTTLACKLIDAQFPPYEQVIPKEPSAVITLDRAALLATLDRCMALWKSETRGVKLSFSGGTVDIVSDHPDLGTHRETLDTSGVVVSRAIGVSPSYLHDILSALECERVTLGVSGELDPILVTSASDSARGPMYTASHIGVVMPMRI